MPIDLDPRSVAALCLQPGRGMTLIADLRSGLRLWLRRPGIALPAVLSLAVGLGAGTSIFAIAST
ncbi:MAG TPA: hypothetical protein VM493_06245, partial [Vicinamibacterales bacterium]|nr:hypothetical protein [Vicinamibacterales bacterium]